MAFAPAHANAKCLPFASAIRYAQHYPMKKNIKNN